MTARALFLLFASSIIGMLAVIHLNEVKRCEAVADQMHAAWDYVVVDGCLVATTPGQWMSLWKKREAGR